MLKIKNNISKLQISILISVLLKYHAIEVNACHLKKFLFTADQ